MDKPRRTTETSGSDCRELGGRLKPVADWASLAPARSARGEAPTIGFHRVNNSARQIWGAPPVLLWCCDLQSTRTALAKIRRGERRVSVAQLATRASLLSYPWQIHHPHQPVLARECQRLVRALRLRHA